MSLFFKTQTAYLSIILSGSIAAFKFFANLLSQYKLEDIYNADDFGLFYQCMPDKSKHLKSESCIGGNHSKVRLTGMAAASALEEKLPIFVIGKSKKPRCFNEIRSLQCLYRHQKKAR